MADVFHLQIISPTEKLVDAYASLTEIPGTEGDFGVLPGHAPFFSMIRPGIIHVQLTDGTQRRLFAASGYADVTPASCTILSDHIEDLAGISAADVTETLAAARAALDQAGTPQEKAKAEKLFAAAEALSRAVA